MKKILFVRPSGLPIEYEQLLEETFCIEVLSCESFNEAIAYQRGEGINFLIICDRIFQYTEQGEGGDYGSYSIREVGLELAQHISSRYKMRSKKDPSIGPMVILFLSNDAALLSSARLVGNTHGFYKSKKSDDEHLLLRDYLTQFREKCVAANPELFEKLKTMSKFPVRAGGAADDDELVKELIPAEPLKPKFAVSFEPTPLDSDEDYSSETEKSDEGPLQEKSVVFSDESSKGLIGKISRAVKDIGRKKKD